MPERFDVYVSETDNAPHKHLSTGSIGLTADGHLYVGTSFWYALAAIMEGDYVSWNKVQFIESDTLTELTSDSTLETLFGCTAKAVHDLNLHLSAQDNPHNVTAAQLGLDRVTNKPESELSVLHAKTADDATDATARSSAASAYNLANTMMPKAGGTFTGNVVAYNTLRADNCIRNNEVANAAGSVVASVFLRFNRK